MSFLCNHLTLHLRKTRHDMNKDPSLCGTGVDVSDDLDWLIDARPAELNRLMKGELDAAQTQELTGSIRRGLPV